MSTLFLTQSRNIPFGALRHFSGPCLGLAQNLFLDGFLEVDEFTLKFRLDSLNPGLSLVKQHLGLFFGLGYQGSSLTVGEDDFF